MGTGGASIGIEMPETVSGLRNGHINAGLNGMDTSKYGK